MYTYSTSCACGDVVLNLLLPKAIQSYSARTCDCDFCRGKTLSYLSDTDGHLHMQYKTNYTTQRQGSNQAEFITCAQCSNVVFVALAFNGLLKGAVNISLFLESALMQETTVVSPKLLSADEKRDRWSRVWMPVTVTVNNCAN